MIAVVFRPHTLSLFLGIPSSELYNRETDGRDLNVRSLDELAARTIESDDGRKHRDTVIIYARVAPKTADAIRKRAASENATLGEILEKHLKL